MNAAINLSDRLWIVGLLWLLFSVGCAREVGPNILSPKEEIHGQTPNYYWYGSTKLIIEVDSSLILIEVSSTDTTWLEELRKHPDVQLYRPKNTYASQYITGSQSAFLKAVPAEKIVLTSFAFRLPGETGTAFITDEISVKFQKEPDLKAFEEQFGVVFLEKTPYGAHLFRALKNTLLTANTIKEKTDVIWSHPNFVQIIGR